MSNSLSPTSSDSSALPTSGSKKRPRLDLDSEHSNFVSCPPPPLPPRGIHLAPMVRGSELAMRQLARNHGGASLCYAPCFVIMRWWLSIKYGRSSNSSSTRQTQMAQLHLPTATRSKKNHRSIYGAEMFPWTRPDGSSTPSPKRPTSSFTIPVLQMQPISWCKFVVPDHPHSVKRQLLYWTFMRSFTMDSCRLEST